MLSANPFIVDHQIHPRTAENMPHRSGCARDARSLRGRSATGLIEYLGDLVGRKWPVVAEPPSLYLATLAAEDGTRAVKTILRSIPIHHSVEREFSRSRLKRAARSG